MLANGKCKEEELKVFTTQTTQNTPGRAKEQTVFLPIFCTSLFSFHCALFALG